MTIEIGTVFYRRASPSTLEYHVIGVRDYGDSKQYELECQSCRHGEKCRVLAAFDNYKKLRIIHMLHDDDEYICQNRSWHDHESPFHETLDGVRRECLNKERIYYTEQVERSKANLASNERQLKNCIDALAVIEEADKKAKSA